MDLPALDDDFDLARADVEAFERDGHLRLDRLADPGEIEALRPGLVEAADAVRFERRPLAERDTYGRAFLQLFNLWRQNEAARAFVHARRFAGVAAELLGVPAVRLYHDQGLFKEPGGGPTPWHQDQFYWPLDTDRTITLWMPLVPIDPAMGTMSFASGSHRAGPLGEWPIGDESEAAYAALVAEHGWPVQDDDAFAPGDASFHAGWTLHRAGPNTTQRMREAMTVIYYADGTRVTPLDHPNRRFDRDTWLRGCEPGALAAGPRNPVLWARDGDSAGEP